MNQQQYQAHIISITYKLKRVQPGFLFIHMEKWQNLKWSWTFEEQGFVLCEFGAFIHDIIG